MGKSAFSIFFLFALIANAQPAGDEFKTYFRSIDIWAQTQYYKSTGNFTKSGNNFDSLPNGASYEIWDLDLGGRTLLAPRWSIFGQATLGSAASQSSITKKTLTNSGFSNALIGTDFVMSDGEIALIPEFTFSYPFAKNDENSDNVALSDGAMSASARMIALMRRDWIRFAAYGGYVHRTEGLSSLYTYGLLTEFDYGNFELGVGLRGYGPLSYDQSSDNEAPRNQYFCRANGCSKRFAAINPTLMDADIWGRFRMSREWDLNLGATAALTGQNTSNGYALTVGFVYHWAQAKVRHSGHPTRRVLKPNFEEEVDDGVDQNLFQPSSHDSPSPDAQRRRIKQGMQDDLDKTEMQIESNSSKKRKNYRP